MTGLFHVRADEIDDISIQTFPLAFGVFHDHFLFPLRHGQQESVILDFVVVISTDSFAVDNIGITHAYHLTRIILFSIGDDIIKSHKNVTVALWQLPVEF